jgi:hypothetical protein
MLNFSLMFISKAYVFLTLSPVKFLEIVRAKKTVLPSTVELGVIQMLLQTTLYNTCISSLLVL